MRKEEFYFDSKDGQTRIHAVRWIPDKEIRCVLQIIHGMAEYVERYERLAGVLTKSDILVTGEDHLGHGKSLYGRVNKREDCDIGHPLGYFCQQDPASAVVEDVHSLKIITQQQYPEVPYLFLGHSMGSFMLRNYLCRYGDGIDGAIVMGTGMMPLPVIKLAKGLAKAIAALRGEKHPSMLLNAAAFGTYNRKIKHPDTLMDWLSSDTQEVDKYIKDQLCGFCFTVNGFETLFELIKRLHDREMLQKMPRQLPVFFVSGACDPVGDYGKAVVKTADSFSALGMQRVTCKIYPGMRHEILNERERECVEQDILCWITENVYL